MLQGRLSLQWLPPLELLAEQLDYQVRYAMENSHDWKVRTGQDTPSSPAHLHCVHMAGTGSGKPGPAPCAVPQQPCLQLGSAPQVLQVPRAARKEFLDLRPGTRYHAQVRAQPSGPWYQGSWSAWSKPVVVDGVADPGKGQGWRLQPEEPHG